MSELVERKLTIAAMDGVHLKPAQIFVETAMEFPGVEIRVIRDGNEADGKSILGLLSLGLSRDSEIQVIAQGEGAEKCMVALESVLKRENVI